MKLRFHRRAVEEIDDEVDYHESCQPGLGAALEDEIDAVLDVSLQHPEAAPKWKVRADRRVAVLDRFPFTLPYQITEQGVIILALAHTSRRPGYWSRRRASRR
jgi:toxin ParE1/3/4